MADLKRVLFNSFQEKDVEISIPCIFITVSLWCGIGLLLCAFVYWLGFGRFTVFSQLGIVGPKPLPFIGHIADYFRYNFQFHLAFDDYVKQYGSCFGVFFRGTPTLVVSDPEMLKQILIKDFGNFCDRKIAFDLPEPLSSSLNVVHGERWKVIRNTLTPSFTSGKLRPMSHVMNKITETLLHKLTFASEKGENVDVVKFQRALTLEMILSIGFGMEAMTQTDPNEPLTAKALLALKRPKWITLALGIPGAGKIIKYLPYGFYYHTNPIVTVAKDIIKQRRANTKCRKKDWLQLMLDTQEKPSPNGCLLTDDEVVAQSLIFLLAGFETSSTALVMNCYNLALHQDVQEKLYQEIKDRLPEDEDLPDYDVVQKLEYLDMVISETLRVYPPGYIILRTCNKDCVIKGVPIKKDFNIIIPIYSIHRNKKFWKDPENFDPERFSREEKSRRDPMVYTPFGHGQRSCIGMRFALMMIKIVLTRIIKNFKLEICKETVIPPKIVALATLTVREPIWLKVTKR